MHAERAVAAVPRKRLTIHRVAAGDGAGLDADGAGWKGIAAEAIARPGAAEHAQLRLAHDEHTLYACFEVDDASPWRNRGQDPQRLFKSGDAVDLQLALASGPAASAIGTQHVRLLCAPCDGHALCVLMRPIDRLAPPEAAAVYRSPVGERRFDRVTVLAEAVVTVRVEAARYRVALAVPLTALGLQASAGALLHGDAGFISSNADGTANVARTYWSNPATNLVNDLPSEAWLYPATWGEMVWE